MAHGAYVPENVRWSVLSRDHHRVFLLVDVPGRIYRQRVCIGEVRRFETSGRWTRAWRAFPEGSTEFPPVLDNHVQALEFLKDRWQVRQVVSEIVRPRRSSDEPAPAWITFLGEDPWGDDDE